LDVVPANTRKYYSPSKSGIAPLAGRWLAWGHSLPPPSLSLAPRAQGPGRPGGGGARGWPGRYGGPTPRRGTGGSSGGTGAVRCGVLFHSTIGPLAVVLGNKTPEHESTQGLNVDPSPGPPPQA